MRSGRQSGVRANPAGEGVACHVADGEAQNRDDGLGVADRDASAAQFEKRLEHDVADGHGSRRPRA